MSWAIRESIIFFCLDYFCSIRQVSHFLPTRLYFFFSAIWVPNLTGHVNAICFSRQPDAGQSLACGENYTTFFIIPSIRFVLAHNWKLNAINGDKLIER